MTKWKSFNQMIKVMSLLFVNPAPIRFLFEAGGERVKGPDNTHSESEISDFYFGVFKLKFCKRM